MPQPVTEKLHPAARSLDMLPNAKILQHLLTAQQAAVQAVSTALADIEQAAVLMAAALSSEGRLAYAGAGSSALMAAADGLELSGTFGIDPARVLLLIAGGLPTDSNMPGDSEDNAADGARAAQTLRQGDVVIAVSASGRTPYALALATAARAKGAKVVAIANVPDAALFAESDVAICLPTPPEVVAGSTRLGAGTAQKVTLNLVSTLMGVLLGQVHDGMMVGMVADNAKLRARAMDIVARIAGVDLKAAGLALDAVQGAVKPAVLVACGQTVDQATVLLATAKGNLRTALALINRFGA